jgi:threonylcarbamoyladenosine tRNA methylthiotransferase MtaB
MPQVAPATRKARAARLRAAGEDALARFLEKRVGGAAAVLVERGAEGRTEHFAPIRLRAPAAPGSVIGARVTGSDGAVLLGEAA